MMKTQTRIQLTRSQNHHDERTSDSFDGDPLPGGGGLYKFTMKLIGNGYHLN